LGILTLYGVKPGIGDEFRIFEVESGVEGAGAERSRVGEFGLFLTTERRRKRRDGVN